jgi:hypothetical protein
VAELPTFGPIAEELLAGCDKAITMYTIIDIINIILLKLAHWFLFGKPTAMYKIAIIE